MIIDLLLIGILALRRTYRAGIEKDEMIACIPLLKQVLCKN